jgi:hypothetical protein
MMRADQVEYCSATHAQQNSDLKDVVKRMAETQDLLVLLMDRTDPKLKAWTTPLSLGDLRNVMGAGL